jgi:hypothetical protein
VLAAVILSGFGLLKFVQEKGAVDAMEKRIKQYENTIDTKTGEHLNPEERFYAKIARKEAEEQYGKDKEILKKLYGRNWFVRAAKEKNSANK